MELCVYPRVRLPLESLQSAFDHLVDRAYSISLFTDYAEAGVFTHVFVRHNLNGTHHATSEVSNGRHCRSRVLS